MNHTKIRTLESGGFHMTNKRGGRVYPIGDCVAHGGHDTMEEAAKCYEEYCLREHYDEESWAYFEKRRDRCYICGEWARWKYQAPMYSCLREPWACEDHKGKEIVEQATDITEHYETFGSVSG